MGTFNDPYPKIRKTPGPALRGACVPLFLRRSRFTDLATVSTGGVWPTGFSEFGTIKQDDLPFTNGDLTMKNGDLTKNHGDLTIINGDLTNRNGDLTNTNGD